MTLSSARIARATARRDTAVPRSAAAAQHRQAPWLAAAALAASAFWAAAPARATVDVGVSVQISQPGVYGRIDIGRFPQPQVIVNQPVLVVPGPRPVQIAQPVYMWVPPGHRNNWHRHCGRYNACAVPVVFVEDAWYEQNVKHGKRGKADRGRHGPPPGKGPPGRRD